MAATYLYIIIIKKYFFFIYLEYGPVIMSLHSTLNVLLMTIFTRPYFETTKRMLWTEPKRLIKKFILRNKIGNHIQNDIVVVGKNQNDGNEDAIILKKMIKHIDVSNRIPTQTAYN